jgi:O-succinylbenzoate synthase
MQVTGVEILRLDLELVAPVGTAAGPHDRRPVVVVRVVGDGGSGWGECGALPGGTAVDPALEVVWEALAAPRGAVNRLLEACRARRGRLPDAAQVPRLYSGTAADRMAGAALEMAVLDAELRAAGRSLAGWLGVTAAAVPVGAMVGIPADRRLGSLLAAVDGALASGCARLRVKIEPGWDVEPLRALRAAHPGLALQADANGAYRLGSSGPDDAHRLRALDELGLTCIEQPLPPADLPSLGELAGLLATPVALDESLTTVRRLTDALRYGACEVACLKPARLGGILAARTAAGVCAGAGVPAFVGGFFETGLGRAANAALAGVPGFTLPGDLTDPAGYLVGNPVAYPAPAGGMVAVHGGPGICPALDPDRLVALATEVRRFAPLR